MFSRLRKLFRPSRRVRAEVAEATPRAAHIRARYDAAQDTDENRRHWAAADALDADASNSLAVRKKLRERSRLESGNNGYSKGIERTHAHYVVGLGPKLRMQTSSAGFNAMVEAAWKRWAKAALLRRKLRCIALAKTRDGEGILQATTNPKLRDRVKLNLVPIETDRLTTPFLPYAESGYIDGIRYDEGGYIDGIRYDEDGNVLWYDILPYHPGAQWAPLNVQPQQVSPRFLLHWFSLDRPGQHRGVPEMTSSLNCGANSRRWREATLAAAETAADFSAVLETQQATGEDADYVAPMATLDIEKRMLTALPVGTKLNQFKAEHPGASYESFHRINLNEQARPLGMAYNIAACDATGMNFSSGKLNHQPYYLAVDDERADAEDIILDPLFDLWFAEAVLAYGWSVPADPAPAHSWDWPAHPQIDEYKSATAREVKLRSGQATLAGLYAEDGVDFEEALQTMAQNFGVPIEDMRQILLSAIFKTPTAAPTAADVANSAAE